MADCHQDGNQDGAGGLVWGGGEGVGFLQVGTGKMLPLSPGLSGQLEGRDPSVVKIAPFGGIL